MIALTTATRPTTVRSNWPQFFVSPEDLETSIRCATADIEDAITAHLADAKNRIADRRKAK